MILSGFPEYLHILTQDELCGLLRHTYGADLSDFNIEDFDRGEPPGPITPIVTKIDSERASAFVERFAVATAARLGRRASMTSEED